MDNEIFFKEIKTGFVFGNLMVTRLWSHKGATCIRTLNTASGLYVDIQTTRKGKKQYVNTGSLEPQALKDWIEWTT